MRKLTPEQLEEFKKCQESAAYFIFKYGWLRHTSRGAIPWDKPYPYQQTLVELLQQGENVVVNKSRQIGVSWTAMAYAIWLTIFHPDVVVLVLSAKQQYAIELIKKAKFFFRKLPSWLRPEMNKDTQTEMGFIFRVVEDGDVFTAESGIISLTTTTDSGRGFSAALVIMDEAAFLPAAEETWTAVLPTTSHGGQVLVVSTPNGVNNFFHRVVVQTEAGHSTGFKLVKAYYRDCGFDAEWLARVTIGMTLQQILQEYELQFVTADSPFFDLNQLALCYKPPSEYPTIKEMMVVTNPCYLGVDSSEIGRGVKEPDNHAIEVLNSFGIEIYAYANNRIPLTEFAGHVDELGGERIWVEGVTTKVHRAFPGTVVIERLGPGEVTFNSHIVPDDGVSKKIGRRPNNIVKMRMLNALKQGFNAMDLVITDPYTYSCLQSFEDKSTGAVQKAEAAPGAKDDNVIALAMAYSEFHRAGGQTWELPGMISSLDAQRMIGQSPGDDLPSAMMPVVLPVGRVMSLPSPPASEVWERGSLVDGVDQRMLPPGVQQSDINWN